VTARHVVVMITTSYPRFAGDGIGSFIAPIAKGVAARGHAVHLVAPWHPEIRLPDEEDGVRFHFYKYPPLTGSAAWGYASGLKADTALRPAAWATAPIAFAWGCLKARQIAAKFHATMLHAHWVIPNGVIAAAAARGLPFVVSLHGSDVFVAERSAVAGRGAKYAFDRAGWITACSDDLRTRAIKLGAREAGIDTVPYGVDSERFAPSTDVRAAVRRELGIGDAPFIVTAGRLVRKKGFEYLIDAAGTLISDFANLTIEFRISDRGLESLRGLGIKAPNPVIATSGRVVIDTQKHLITYASDDINKKMLGFDPQLAALRSNPFSLERERSYLFSNDGTLRMATRYENGKEALVSVWKRN